MPVERKSGAGSEGCYENGVGRVIIANMNKTFEERIHILREFNFTFSLQERIVIVGPSGSGKSTLLRCIMGLEEIEAGAIYLDGCLHIQKRVRRTWVNRETQLQMGMIFQNYTLFPHLSVIKNLVLASIHVQKIAPEEAYDKARNLLRRLNLLEKEDVYPSKLSGGQKQRVAIARALMLEPKLMLFDEVTSALDPELVSEVLDVMIQLAEQNMGMVIVTHEMDFARRIASRMVFMDRGNIIEEGPPDAFFQNPREERTRQFLRHFLKNDKGAVL
jgi:polar amino acid transport system ATP-binding protein